MGDDKKGETGRREKSDEEKSDEEAEEDEDEMTCVANVSPRSPPRAPGEVFPWDKSLAG